MSDKAKTWNGTKGNGTIKILGRPVCLKRRIDGKRKAKKLAFWADSGGNRHGEFGSNRKTSKWVWFEIVIESRRNMIQPWGNRPLCVTGSHVYEIMEK